MMKKTVFTMALFFSVGCQSFPYYDPAKPHRGQTQFYNNYDNSPKESFWKWQWERWTAPRAPQDEFAPEVVKSDVHFLKENTQKRTLTWIGHSSMLLQIDGVNILIDPVFSERASPFSFAGPKRWSSLPFQSSELPRIDLVVISHGHYDHLDLATLKAVSKNNPEALMLVPLGNQKLLRSEGIQNVKELDWWEQQSFKNLTLTFTPAQHWMARGVFDRDQTLWGGWFVKAENYAFAYVGDTGYSKDFQDIRERLGAADFSAIPIGAYEPRWFMRKQHVNPEEALKIHQDLGSKKSLGVHWGTFKLADERMMAPVQDLQKARDLLGVAPEDFFVLKHGETIELN